MRLPSGSIRSAPTRRRHYSRLRIIGRGESSQQRRAKSREFSVVVDLQAEDVFDVEHIDGPHTIGGDVGGGDLQALFADRGGYVV
jgi:hypothetical protein